MISLSPSSLKPETQRLFFALWPEPELSQRLYGLAGKLLRGDGRRVAPENIHLTLAFLGPVDAPFRRCAEKVASALSITAFTLTLEKTGCWSRSGILWAGPGQTPQPLLSLVQTLNDGLSGCGYQPERRAYAAHLTMARQVRRCPDRHPIEPLAWDVRRFCLVQSRVGAEGAWYEILRAWDLNPPES
jgi:RNA 2',3'-cyclic 3'-phosphodiesterase